MTVPTFFQDAPAFRAWLQAHAGSAAELLVGFHKVASGRPCMSWSESVDEALCFGWIDGVRRRVDEHTYTIRFTPRKERSIWSAVNMAKYHALDAAGRVMPAGAQAFSHRTEARSVVYAYEQESVAALSAAEMRAFKRDKQGSESSDPLARAWTVRGGPPWWHGAARQCRASRSLSRSVEDIA